MGFKEWARKYYPVPAHEVSKEDALSHSLNKWRGLRPTVLKRYGLKLRERSLYSVDEPRELPVLTMGTDTCALCEHYYRYATCADCPLYELLGHRCDARMTFKDSDPANGPYIQFVINGDVEPMIKVLEKATKREGKANGRTRILRKNRTGR